METSSTWRLAGFEPKTFTFISPFSLGAQYSMLLSLRYGLEKGVCGRQYLRLYNYPPLYGRVFLQNLDKKKVFVKKLEKVGGCFRSFL